AAGEDDVWIERVWREIAELEAARRVPVAIADLAEVAAVGDGGLSAVLLRGEHVVGESVVCDHVIELSRRLVVPAAPRRPRVDADDGALIDAGEEPSRISSVDPHELKIVAARCAGECLERPPAV